MTDTRTETLTMHLPAIESALENALLDVASPGDLGRAARYAMLGGGKRLRPMLCLRCCEAAGGGAEQATPAAVAIELVHGFSLVHDDLPALDDDDLRRGRPTLHRVQGEAMAVLAGDFLLTRAFTHLASKVSDAALARTLSSELGAATEAMIVGQVYDTLGGFDDALDDAARLNLVHANKTAALLRVACRMGALCGGASDDTLERLTSYGDAIGLMFQAVDDLIDVTQKADHAGKATGKDAVAGKLTYPGVVGVDGTRDAIANLRDRALRAIEPLPAAGPLHDLCMFMAERTR